MLLILVLMGTIAFQDHDDFPLEMELVAKIMRTRIISPHACSHPILGSPKITGIKMFHRIMVGNARRNDKAIMTTNPIAAIPIHRIIFSFILPLPRRRSLLIRRGLPLNAALNLGRRARERQRFGIRAAAAAPSRGGPIFLLGISSLGPP